MYKYKKSIFWFLLVESKWLIRESITDIKNNFDVLISIIRSFIALALSNRLM